MDNLQKLIDLAKADGGKFFVLDDKGNPVLVIMGIGDYEKVLIRRLSNQVEDIEEINRQIAAAQTGAPVEVKRTAQQNARDLQQDQLKSEVIDSTFSFDPPVQQPEQNRMEFDEF